MLCSVPALFAHLTACPEYPVDPSECYAPYDEELDSTNSYFLNWLDEGDPRADEIEYWIDDTARGPKWTLERTEAIRLCREKEVVADGERWSFACGCGGRICRATATGAYKHRDEIGIVRRPPGSP